MERHSNGAFYIAWYDTTAQQTRRRSLRTRDKAAATKQFDATSAASEGGDPRSAAEIAKIVTVADLIAWYAGSLGSTLAAKGQMAATVNHVTAYFGRRGVLCLGNPDTAADFVTWIRARGLSLGYAARICAQLRTAVRAAHKRKLIREPYVIPNPQSKAEQSATPRKGRPMSPAEIARLVDAMPTPHMVNYVRLGLATAARLGAILDLKAESYLDSVGLIHLNPEGRVQTKKYRPVVIAIEAIRAWLRALPPGHVVSTDARPGQRIKSIKTAWRAACRRAGFGADVTSYSLRYSVAMAMRVAGVATEEISVQLGHMPVDVKVMTLTYSPYDATYLRDATAAIAAFYAEVDRLVTNPLWHQS